MKLVPNGRLIKFTDLHIGSVFYAHNRFWTRTSFEGATELTKSGERGSACSFLVDPQDEFVEMVIFRMGET